MDGRGLLPFAAIFSGFEIATSFEVGEELKLYTSQHRQIETAIAKIQSNTVQR